MPGGASTSLEVHSNLDSAFPTLGHPGEESASLPTSGMLLSTAVGAVVFSASILAMRSLNYFCCFIATSYANATEKAFDNDDADDVVVDAVLVRCGEPHGSVDDHGSGLALSPDTP